MRIAGWVIAALWMAMPAWAQEVVSKDASRLAKTGPVRVMIAFEPSPTTDPVEAREHIRNTREQIESAFAPGEYVAARHFERVNAFAGEVTAAGLDRLAGDPAVRRVDVDTGGSGNLLHALPLANVDLAKALGWTGAGVTVAVLDSGYDSDHPDLSDDLVAEACFCSGGGGCCPSGSASQTGAGAAEDDHGHGTNVTGIITSAGNVAPEGGAPDADVVAVKVLDASNSFCCSSDVVAGLDWILASRPDVDIVNLSLGTHALFTGDCDTATSTTLAFATAIDALRASGVSVFVSTGNDGSGTQMQAPACVSSAISVGAVWDLDVGSISVLGCTESSTAADQVTCFSNSNASTDLMAPGAPVTSSGRGGGTSTFYGTSQASPLAAACAALMLESDPALSPQEIEDALEASPVSVSAASNGLGFPRVDCFEALAAAPSRLPASSRPALFLIGAGLVLAGMLAARGSSLAKRRKSLHVEARPS